MRIGESLRVGEPDREAAIAELLRVHDPGSTTSALVLAGPVSSARPASLSRGPPRARRCHHGRRAGTPLRRPARSGRRGHRRRCGRRGRWRSGDRRRASPEARAAGTLWPTRRTPGATPPSRASASGGRSGAADSIRPRILPARHPGEAARIERTFEIDPETLVVAASDEVPLLIAYGTPGRRRGDSRTGSCSGWSAPSCRSSRRWSSRSCSVEGSAREPGRVRGGIRRRAGRPDRRVHGRVDLQRRRGAPPADRQGLVEHRRRPSSSATTSCRRSCRPCAASWRSSRTSSPT